MTAIAGEALRGAETVLTVTLRIYHRPGRKWARLTAYGDAGGRYGSIASAALALPAGELPRDPEELASLALDGLVQVVYAT